MQADWELSRSLQSDGHGVRCVAALGAVAAAASNTNSNTSNHQTTLLTGSQGGTLCQYGVSTSSRNDDDTAIQLLPYQHNHAVTAISAIPHTNQFVTGCKDHAVRVFEITTNNNATNDVSAAAAAADSSTTPTTATTTTSTTTVKLLKELPGHEKPVTSLDVMVIATGGGGGDSDHDSRDVFLLSGSWDGTAKLWNLSNFSLVATLPDHENSVCVCFMNFCPGTTNNNNHTLTVATGSAGRATENAVTDHAVRLWQVRTITGDVKLLKTVANDHDGPIRDIAYLRNCNINLLATCSNDGTVKLRDASTAVCQSTLMPFTQHHQQHPPMLLSLVSRSDFLAASAEDGHVVVWGLGRSDSDACDHNIFSAEPQILRHPECVWQVAAVPATNDYDLATAGQDGVLRIWTRAAERQAPLAEREALAEAVRAKAQATQSGPAPDEVAKLPRWELNLDRRGTSEGQVQLFQKNGVAIAAQWSTASQTWIEVGEVTGQADTGTVDGVQYDHVFPIEIEQQGGSGGVANLQIGYNNGENPFTAAQRFIDAHVLPQQHPAEIANYIQQRAGQAPRTLGAASATTTASTATSGTPLVAYDHLPARGYKSFELSDKAAAATLDKMKGKMQEFGLMTDDGDALQSISALMETLAATNRYHSTKVSDAQLQTVSAQLQAADLPRAFPVLDLLRLTVLHPDAANSARTPYWTTVMARAVALCQQQQDTTASSSSSSAVGAGPAAAAVAIPLLSLRLIANAFRGGPGAREAAASQLPAALQCAQAHAASSNKNIRLAVATVLHNAALYLHEQHKSGSSNSSNNNSAVAATSMVPLLDQIIAAKTYEAEALCRGLVALGTLALCCHECKAAAQSRHLASKVEPAASPHPDPVKVVAREVYSVLQ